MVQCNKVDALASAYDTVYRRRESHTPLFVVSTELSEADFEKSDMFRNKVDALVTAYDTVRGILLPEGKILAK